MCWACAPLDPTYALRVAAISVSARTQHVVPDARRARELGRRGERGADAWLIQGKREHPRSATAGWVSGHGGRREPSPSLFVLSRGGRRYSAPPPCSPRLAISESASRQRPLLMSRGGEIIADAATAGIGPARVNRDADVLRRVIADARPDLRASRSYFCDTYKSSAGQLPMTVGNCVPCDAASTAAPTRRNTFGSSMPGSRRASIIACA